MFLDNGTTWEKTVFVQPQINKLRTSPIIIDEFADGGNNVDIVERLVLEALGKKPGFFGVRKFLVHYIYVFTLHLAQTAFGIDAGYPEVLLGYPNADP